MNIIVAVDRHWAIGKNGDLLVHSKEDMKHFKELTTGNIVIMGRKTFESLPKKKPLPNRTNIILTTDKNYKVDGAIVCHSKEEIMYLLKLQEVDSDRVFIIGGEKIYKLFINDCNTIYLTKFHRTCKDADTFFPNPYENKWKFKESTKIKRDANAHVYYSFITLKR